MRAALVCLVLIAACSSKKDGGDKCQRVIEKSMKVLNDLSTMRGAKVKLGAEEKKKLVEDCRKQVKAGKPDPNIECVLAAKDDAGVSACYTKGYEEYLARSKSIEAKLQLGKLGKNAKVAFVTNATFPVGKVGPTPATPCCGEQTKQCMPTETTWADPVWKSLEFTVEGAFNYQYTYDSDGKTFTATATGDPTCSGKPTTTTIKGSVGEGGEPEVTPP